MEGSTYMFGDNMFGVVLIYNRTEEPWDNIEKSPTTFVWCLMLLSNKSGISKESGSGRGVPNGAEWTLQFFIFEWTQ